MGKVREPRSKMLNIRLTEYEHLRLRELCESKGSRSVSDLMRDAIFHLLMPSASTLPPETEDRFRNLDQALAQVGQHMEAIGSHLENVQSGFKLCSACSRSFPALRHPHDDAFAVTEQPING